MELWIRSQDGERLTRCYDLRVYYAKQDGVWVIESCDDLGSYETKERALEVLDEIQKYLKVPKATIDKFGNVDYLNADVKVYEMPKE